MKMNIVFIAADTAECKCCGRVYEDATQEEMKDGCPADDCPSND